MDNCLLKLRFQPKNGLSAPRRRIKEKNFLVTFSKMTRAVWSGHCENVFSPSCAFWHFWPNIGEITLAHIGQHYPHVLQRLQQANDVTTFSRDFTKVTSVNAQHSPVFKWTIIFILPANLTNGEAKQGPRRGKGWWAFAFFFVCFLKMICNAR